MRRTGPKTYYIYIVASRARTLYIGITSAIEHRLWQHKTNHFQGFTSRYRCDRLVYFEQYANPETAIAREKQLKTWRREKKIALIGSVNPTWVDLSEAWGKPVPLWREPKQAADPSTPLRSGRDDTGR